MFRGLATLVVAACVGLWASSAHADDPSIELPAANLRLRNGDDNLRFDVRIDTDGRTLSCAPVVGLYGRFGASDQNGTLIARLDEFVPKWRTGLSLRELVVVAPVSTDPGGSDSSESLLLEFEAEFDVTSFDFQPLSQTSASRTTEASLASTFVVGYQRASPSLPWAFELRTRYERAWKESDQVPVTMSPLPAGGESMGTLRVTEAPSAHATLVSRAFFYFGVGNLGLCSADCGTFAIGLDAAVVFGGNAVSAMPSVDTVASWNPAGRDFAIRGELWFYYHPITSPANLRIGLAPFIQGQPTCGRASDCGVSGGVLVSMRVGEPWRY